MSDLVMTLDEAERSLFDSHYAPPGNPIGTPAATLGAAQSGARFAPAYTKALKVLDAEELLSAEFPPRSLMFAPWLPDKGLAMVYAPRGVGKTWFALNIAHAISCGGEFLGWQAPNPRAVFHIDGEMPAATLQERYAAVVAASMRDAPRENFRLLAADVQPDGLPDLADPEAQRFYEGVIAGADLIIVDNLSTIARGLRENEADAFGPIQSWLLAQRAAGRSALLIHHAGKGGGQRGTSRKEDVLDTVISLSRPPGYLATEGARFEVRFTKNRGFWGLDAEPFEARLTEGRWSTAPIVADDSNEALAALRDQGLSIRDIAERSGVSKSEVQRRLKGGNS
jgi:putative DNA primase/helicase